MAEEYSPTAGDSVHYRFERESAELRKAIVQIRSICGAADPNLDATTRIFDICDATLEAATIPAL